MIVARAAVVLEKTCTSLTDAALRLASWSDSKATYFRKFHVIVLGTTRPTLEQWVNRLVEYVDSRFLLIAYQRFLVLIENGLTPEKAFREVVGEDVS